MTNDWVAGAECESVKFMRTLLRGRSSSRARLAGGFIRAMVLVEVKFRQFEPHSPSTSALGIGQSMQIQCRSPDCDVYFTWSSVNFVPNRGIA